jgi:1-acyl-sn-glycerol-3-phosphate acyltransferase
MELSVVFVAGCLWVVHALVVLCRIDDHERWTRWHRNALRRALGWLMWSGTRCLHFSIEEVGESLDSRSAQGPTLVLARHAGPGDSFVLVHMLLTKYEPGVRIVLKDVLQFDPALDIVLNRLGCCFLPAHAGPDGLTRLARVTAELGPDEALLLFPEGANWTPRRWRQAIRKLRLRQSARATVAAEAMPHVLPPHLGGVSACLDARPEVTVVIAAHAGLDRIASVRELWAAIPFRRAMVVKFWKTNAPPSGKEERRTWLTAQWATVDRWIDSCDDENGVGRAIAM